MNRWSFIKYQGTGNDFILFPSEIQPENVSGPLIRKLCDRHFGIGADGILFICPSEKADFKMRMFNPDGTEAEMCGNGIRCFAKHLRDEKLSLKSTIPIESASGFHLCRVFTNNGEPVTEVEVGMGLAKFERNSVGMQGEGEFIAQPIEAGALSTKATAVSMGNPHLVIFERPSMEEINRIGPHFESHSLFPERTNVEFAEVIDDQRIEVTVFERGAGITLACGTGACAAFAAAAAEMRIDPTRPVEIKLPGGSLTIHRDDDGEIWMKGPAVRVFDGMIDPEFD